MATSTGSNISVENGDNPKNVDHKQSAPAAGVEARRSMVKSKCIIKIQYNI